MYSETSGEKPPLPPVRTRWKAGAGTAAGHGRGLLGPVKSGLFAAFEPQTPVIEAEPAHSPPAEPEPEQPWLDTPAIEEYEAAELLLEVSVDIEELALTEPVDATQEAAEPTGAAEDEALQGLQPIGEPLDIAEAIHSRPAPLSAWDLGTRRDEAEAEQLRMNRMREEWEALGQALIESLVPIAGETPELVNAWPAEAPPAETTPESVAADGIEGLEPLGAGFDREEAEATQEPASPGRAYGELAQRLEKFAAALRTEGRYAITRAQLSGDRMDNMLAGFAAGWLAARGE